jgi:hypothetical protein
MRAGSIRILWPVEADLARLHLQAGLGQRSDDVDQPSLDTNCIHHIYSLC